MIKELIYDSMKTKTYDQEEKGLHFGASYICDCVRKIYYKKTKTEPSNPITEAALLKMEMGKVVHSAMQEKLKHVMIDCEIEKFIEYKELMFKYFYDAKISMNKKHYILEVKTIYANGFRAIENQAKLEHILQLMLYMIFEGVENGVLLYIGRDNGFIVEHHYNLKDLQNSMYLTELIHRLNKLIELKENINNNIIPDREYEIRMKKIGNDISEKFTKDKVNHKTDWQCSYCQYRDLCWNKVIQEFKKSDKQFFINGEMV